MAKQLSDTTINRTFRRDDISEAHIGALQQHTGEDFTVLTKRLYREEFERRNLKLPKPKKPQS